MTPIEPLVIIDDIARPRPRWWQYRRRRWWRRNDERVRAWVESVQR